MECDPSASTSPTDHAPSGRACCTHCAGRSHTHTHTPPPPPPLSSHPRSLMFHGVFKRSRKKEWTPSRDWSSWLSPHEAFAAGKDSGPTCPAVFSSPALCERETMDAGPCVKAEKLPLLPRRCFRRYFFSFSSGCRLATLSVCWRLLSVCIRVFLAFVLHVCARPHPCTTGDAAVQEFLEASAILGSAARHLPPGGRQDCCRVQAECSYCRREAAAASFGEGGAPIF